MSKLKSIAIIVSLFCAVSCGEYELLEHQRVCKRRADSTFRADIKLHTSVTDSICNINKDRYYQEALDSLIPTRIAEMKKLISK